MPTSRHLVHRLGPDLDLERLAVERDDRGVERLVEVVLGDRDVVVELAGDRAPQRVDDAERRVTVAHVVDQDADGVDVVDLAELRALALHLLPDAVDVFRAALEVGLDAGRLEPGRQLRDGAIDVGLAALAPGVEELGQLAEALGLERLEGEVLELPLHLPDPEPLGERGVDLHRLAGDALLLLGRQAVQRAHVVQPVGELDEHDPDVLGHRQQHLADVLGLLLLVAVGAELGQLGHAVDELSDLGAELLLDVGQAEFGVLGDVVQEGRLDRDRVDPELGQDLGRGDRVRDERVAGRPHLAFVRGDREIERPPDRLQVGARVLLEDRGVEGRAQRLEIRSLGLLGSGDDGRAPWTPARRGVRRGLGLGRSPWPSSSRSPLEWAWESRLPSRQGYPQPNPARCSAASASARSFHGRGPSGPRIDCSWPFPASSTMSPGRARSMAASMASRRSAITRRS